VYIYSLFILLVAAVCGVLALGVGLYFGHSTINLIYPELLDRPNVLRHRYQAFWDRECLTPAGKEARSRFFVFAFVGLGALTIAGGMVAQIERTEPLPSPCDECVMKREDAAVSAPDAIQISPVAEPIADSN
jgi:hypothetical protein